jgi:hypothetical protein
MGEEKEVAPPIFDKVRIVIPLSERYCKWMRERGVWFQDEECFSLGFQD